MVQSEASDVDGYLAEAPAAHRRPRGLRRPSGRARHGQRRIRFRTPERIDFELVRDPLRATVAGAGGLVC
ncbi:hypothetical protein [Nocardia abscessus]|uniref:hypothetical protein n=1 Tax=Nocardia abscessus TaxID=120957 RepID=UPI002456E511|nr:hypothetical protein [Nocardia abscessus]